MGWRQDHCRKLTLHSKVRELFGRDNTQPDRHDSPKQPEAASLEFSVAASSNPDILRVTRNQLGGFKSTPSADADHRRVRSDRRSVISSHEWTSCIHSFRVIMTCSSTGSPLDNQKHDNPNHKSLRRGFNEFVPLRIRLCIDLPIRPRIRFPIISADRFVCGNSALQPIPEWPCLSHP